MVNKKIEIVYIAGPYRSKTINGVYENIYAARKYAKKYWNLGYAVICPHMNSAFLDDEDTDEVFLEGDKEIIRRCDILVLMPTWQKSEGAKAERMVAKEKGLKIIYEK